MEGASVAFYGETHLTDTGGSIEFDSIPHGGPYEYVILNDGYQVVSGTIFVNRDTVVQIELVSTSGIQISEKMKFTVYPNPASDKLFIASSLGRLDAEILGISGRVIIMQKEIAPVQPVDISPLGNGTYFIRIINDSFTSGLKKFVVVK